MGFHHEISKSLSPLDRDPPPPPPPLEPPARPLWQSFSWSRERRLVELHPDTQEHSLRPAGHDVDWSPSPGAVVAPYIFLWHRLDSVPGIKPVIRSSDVNRVSESGFQDYALAASCRPAKLTRTVNVSDSVSWANWGSRIRVDQGG